MIDKLLGFGTLFDWITPLISLIQRILNGPVSDFDIPADNGIGTGTIKRFLRRHGIKVWSVMYDFEGDVIMFTVRQRDAAYVYDLLWEAGIPILYASIETDF